MAVSDAAMLAPEEVFAGKGDIKEETELTQEDRKRRRAKKKRKFKGKLIAHSWILVLIPYVPLFIFWRMDLLKFLPSKGSVA